MSRLLCGLIGVLMLATVPLSVQAQESEMTAAPLLSIGEVLADDDGDTIPELLEQRVRVRGVVTIPPGILAEQHFQVAIQDQTGGLMLFAYEMALPLEVGEFIEAEGVVQQYRGAVQLQDIRIERHGQSQVPEPLSLPLSEAANWEHLGERLRVEGTAGPASGGSFGAMLLTDDGGDSINVFFPQKVIRTFPFERFPEGSRIAVEGVMTLYKQAWPFDSGYQLIVTSPDQVELIGEPAPDWLRWLQWVVGVVILLVVLALAIFYWHYRRQKEREAELATLNDLSSMLSSPGLSREQLASRACQTMTRFGLIDVVMIHVFDRYGHLRLAGVAGMEESAARELSFGSRGIAEADGLPDSTALARETERRGVHLISLLPLTARTHPVGVLAAFSRQSARETAAQQRTLVAGAKLIALGLENMEVHQRAEADREELKQLAVTDDLTGLYNRRFLDEYLRIQTAMATRAGSSLAFLALDLDHFKDVNDSYGHEAGDRVLIAVADEIRNCTRTSDLPVRVGGEEFLVVMTETDVEGALAFAERLRERVEALVIEVVEGELTNPTISIGVAIYPQHGIHVRTVLRACDEALYRSKRGGRNRVSVAGEAPVA